MTQDELKQQVGAAAVAYVLDTVPAGAVLGIGTGSTANCFIDALAAHRDRYRFAVSSSQASTARLKTHGFAVLDPNEVETLSVYVDGADEINARGHMIKGGGGALSREKIVASIADVFVCIADASKRVETLGAFPLPIEVLPMATRAIMRRVSALGGTPRVRSQPNGAPYQTDNGNPIVDAAGLKITDPLALEQLVNSWPGVVTVGLFAARGADLCLFGTANGVERVDLRSAS